MLGRYRLTSPLGAGAFATVWLAIDERLEREVAVKIIPKRRVIAARFEREVWAAARLAHPAIVTLYEAVAEEEAAYLVSELVKGFTLEEALSAGRLSDREIVAIGVALCDALAYAHSEGIIHRDVKPSNILIPERPPAATPPAKLTDFGVARSTGGDSLTATGDVIGTAAYMAPEQAAGRTAAAAADLYSLALVLYEGLTGVNPLAAASAAQPTTRLGLYLPPLRRQRRELPRELGHGIDLALRPRPGERGTVGELREALELALPAMSDRRGVVGAPWRPTAPWRPSESSPAESQYAQTSATHHASPALTAVTRLLSLRDAPTTASEEPDTSAREPSAGPRSTLADQSAPAPVPLPARASAAALGAVLTGWLAAHALAPAPLAPAAAALAAAGVLLALPRVGYLIVAAGLTILAAIGGHSGEALVLGVAALVPVFASPSAEPPWPLAAGAPLLGAIGLGGAWPAIAARAGSVRARAVLGLVGWLWLAVATPLTGASLYLVPPGAEPPLSLWSSSPYQAAHQVLGGLLSSGALAPALVWALAAAVLPLLVGKKSLLLDVGRVALWGVMLVVCTQAAIALTHVGIGQATIHGAVLGAVGAAAVALAPSLLTAWRKTHSGYMEPGLP